MLATEEKPPSERLAVRNVRPARRVPDLVEDVRAGLLEPPRALPPKYFYDSRGSELFDRICDTREYYPTRTEAGLLRRHAADIIGHVRPDQILELGSGTSRKTRHLLDACAVLDCSSSYAPFDVCKEMVLAAAGALAAEYEWLAVTALIGDYHAGFEYLPATSGRRLYAFLGGTIGNFTHSEAVAFLSELRAHINSHDWLLLGADRVKDVRVLNAAYNDSDGVTAQFNRNVLHVLNRALNADFDPESFRHHAFFHEARAQIEMHLVSKHEHSVRIDAIQETLTLARNESILTEISRKFTRAGLEELLDAAGFETVRHYEPANRYFSLVLARPV